MMMMVMMMMMMMIMIMIMTLVMRSAGGQDGGDDDDHGVWLYLIFDVVFLDGKEVGAEADLFTRLAALGGRVGAWSVPFEGGRLKLRVKEMRDLKDIRQVR
jgi:hypothetical protein